MAQHGHHHQRPAEADASCHLGAGSSLRRSRDGPQHRPPRWATTPLRGLVIASRSGSVDPGLCCNQLRAGLTVEELERSCKKRVGAAGPLGFSAVTFAPAAARPQQQTMPGAALALEGFPCTGCCRAKIGAMAAKPGRCVECGIALTGGIGENDTMIRSELRTAGLAGAFCFGVVPADEEGMINRLCRRC